MTTRSIPDLSHLSGREVEKVAEALVSSNLKVVLSNMDALKVLNTDELGRLSELAAAATAKCGGIGCG